jgi:hypothetical protein
MSAIARGCGMREGYRQEGLCIYRIGRQLEEGVFEMQVWGLGS